MKEKILFVGGAFVVAAIFALKFPETQHEHNAKKHPVVSCRPDWDIINQWIAENDIPPIPGAGNYRWKISTRSDSAQFYFNQGINTYYAFHIIESMASFKKAEKFDPACAMIYWAQALAYGPNINDLGYAASPEALIASKKALDLSSENSTKEKILIEAMKVRYSADSTQKRSILNQLYVDKMKEAYTSYPRDADVAALYADALMLQHPWDLWNINGTPKPWTPLIRQVLEKLLDKTPNHPGANHYYIHVMEPSPFAVKARPSADRLGKLTPGLSHTVHMPSHIYLRTGEYAEGVAVNEAAVKSYKRTIPLYAPVTGADFLYIIHNLHMQTNNSMLAGRMGYSVQSAVETRNSIPKDYLSIPGALGNAVQYIYMTPALVDVRFGKWKELLNAPQPESTHIYATILYHFGRGMAYANTNKAGDARKELQRMLVLMKDSTLAIPLTPFSAALDGAIIAQNILAGTIDLKDRKFTDAIMEFENAVKIEESMVYNEPRDWLLNPKHYLGNAFIKAGRYAEAETTFKQDLKNNNENGWALYGLYQVYTLLRKKADADELLERFRASFEKSDIKLSAPVF